VRVEPGGFAEQTAVERAAQTFVRADHDRGGASLLRAASVSGFVKSRRSRSLRRALHSAAWRRPARQRGLLALRIFDAATICIAFGDLGRVPDRLDASA